MVNEPIIKIRQLTKRYAKSKVNALKAINLDIMPGEFFGLLGPNGSGKTTLISILCGLLKPTSGQVTINQMNALRKIKTLKSMISLVPQEVALYPTLTLKQNLHYFGRLYGLHGSDLNERMEHYLDLVQLRNFAHVPIENYSGGMKRRANLIAGLIHEPKIIFLDEATVNVDVQSRQVIFEGLQALHAQGKTLVYTTHYLEEAEQYCSQVAIIDEGNIIAQGTPRALIDRTENCNNLGDVFLHFTGKQLRDE